MPDDAQDARLAGYVRALFAPEDETLEEMRYEIARKGFPEIYISAEQGRLLQVLLAAVDARDVLEIGTLGGYSAIWMARALPPDGRLVTLELREERAALARDFVARAGLDEVVQVRVGDALELLNELDEEDARFDVVFIDADKERYGEYLDWALALVRSGGLILADNAFQHGRVLDEESESEAVRAVQAFNERLARDPRLVSTVLPVRDGLTVSVVR